MPSRLVPVCQVLWRGQGARCQCEFTLQCDTLLIADTLDNNAGHTFLTVVRTQRNYRRDPQIRPAITTQGFSFRRGQPEAAVRMNAKKPCLSGAP
jgi:hypothetical protein